MSTVKDISILIPVYNSEATIAELTRKLIAELTPQYTYEIILVNDGSRDNSYAICKGLAEENEHIKFLSLFRNFGQISALMAGLNEMNSRICIIMDDDLQNPPEDIHILINKINEGFDYVFGMPEKIEQDTFRVWGSRFTYKMGEIMLGKPKDIYPSSYLALTDKIVAELIKYEGPFPYLAGLLFRVSKNGTNVKVNQNPRKYGSSNYTFKKLLSLWMNGFTNFSILPLRMSSLLGFVTASLGFLMLIGLFIMRILYGEFLSGWASIFVAVTLFSGIQLLALGIVGEYIGRIFMLLNRSPQFSVKEKYNCKK